MPAMRLLHTSDWHIGRTFQTHPTLDHLGLVLGALTAAVREHRVDVVLVAGDVFDTANPSADALDLLSRALGELRAPEVIEQVAPAAGTPAA